MGIPPWGPPKRRSEPNPAQTTLFGIRVIIDDRMPSGTITMGREVEYKIRKFYPIASITGIGNTEDGMRCHHCGNTYYGARCEACYPSVSTPRGDREHVRICKKCGYHIGDVVCTKCGTSAPASRPDEMPEYYPTDRVAEARAAYAEKGDFCGVWEWTTVCLADLLASREREIEELRERAEDNFRRLLQEKALRKHSEWEARSFNTDRERLEKQLGAADEIVRAFDDDYSDEGLLATLNAYRSVRHSTAEGQQNV